MNVKLIGEPFGRQLVPGDKFRVLSQDFIMVRDDGFIVVMEKGVGRTNGASIPWLFQPILGHPLKKLNPYWSCHHDGLYNGSARVFDVRAVPADQLRYILADWTTLKGSECEVTQWPRRKWADVGMKAAAKAIGEPTWKCRLAYRAVRCGGLFPWWKARRQRA